VRPNYLLSSRHPDFVVSSIIDATRPSADQVEFTLGTDRYAFHLTWSKSAERDSGEELELRRW